MYVVKRLNISSGYLHPGLQDNLFHDVHFPLISERPYQEAERKPGGVLEVNDCQSTIWIISILQQEVVEVDVTVTQLVRPSDTRSAVVRSGSSFSYAWRACQSKFRGRSF